MRVDIRSFLAPLEFVLIVDSKLVNAVRNNKKPICELVIKRAAIKIKNLPVPSDYKETIENYAKSLVEMADAIHSLLERTPSRINIMKREETILNSSEAWIAEKPASNSAESKLATPKSNPNALSFAAFLHCAVPSLYQMKKEYELFSYLASRCCDETEEGWKIDHEFLNKLKETCLSEDQREPKMKAPLYPPTYLTRDFLLDNIYATINGHCFTELNNDMRKKELGRLSRAYSNIVQVSSSIKELNKKQVSLREHKP